MKVIHAPDSSGHHPLFEFDSGHLGTAWEVPSRSDVILSDLTSLPFVDISESRKPFGLNYILEVHNSEYVKWLQFQSEVLGENEVVYPSVFPFGRRAKTENIKGKRGQFCFDTYTPVFNATYDVAVRSAWTALEAAEFLVKGNENQVYALCRPPGHHAESARCGGYCYFNNTAIAANFLAQNGAKVAILDVDIHHGNGTQGIFWRREDIATFSIHCSPEFLYPYFSGYVDETGSGQGLGKNTNYPLAPESDEFEYQAALELSLEGTQKHRPDFLVVALGVDTHESDPIGNFNLSTNYFNQMAQTIDQLDVPTIVVQEGGYSLEHIGKSVASFLTGLS